MERVINWSLVLDLDHILTPSFTLLDGETGVSISNSWNSRSTVLNRPVRPPAFRKECADFMLSIAKMYRVHLVSRMDLETAQSILSPFGFSVIDAGSGMNRTASDSRKSRSLSSSSRIRVPLKGNVDRPTAPASSGLQRKLHDVEGDADVEEEEEENILAITRVRRRRSCNGSGVSRGSFSESIDGDATGPPSNAVVVILFSRLASSSAIKHFGAYSRPFRTIIVDLPSEASKWSGTYAPCLVFPCDKFHAFSPRSLPALLAFLEKCVFLAENDGSFQGDMRKVLLRLTAGHPLALGSPVMHRQPSSSTFDFEEKPVPNDFGSISPTFTTVKFTDSAPHPKRSLKTEINHSMHQRRAVESIVKGVLSGTSPAELHRTESPSKSAFLLQHADDPRDALHAAAPSPFSRLIPSYSPILDRKLNPSLQTSSSKFAKRLSASAEAVSHSDPPSSDSKAVSAVVNPRDHDPSFSPPTDATEMSPIASAEHPGGDTRTLQASAVLAKALNRNAASNDNAVETIRVYKSLMRLPSISIAGQRVATPQMSFLESYRSDRESSKSPQLDLMVSSSRVAFDSSGTESHPRNASGLSWYRDVLQEARSHLRLPSLAGTTSLSIDPTEID
eukprot:ANDGO_02018.mRNA.1 hypothetical protein